MRERVDGEKEGEVVGQAIGVCSLWQLPLAPGRHHYFNKKRKSTHTGSRTLTHAHMHTHTHTLTHTDRHTRVYRNKINKNVERQLRKQKAKAKRK